MLLLQKHLNLVSKKYILYSQYVNQNRAQLILSVDMGVMDVIGKKKEKKKPIFNFFPLWAANVALFWVHSKLLRLFFGV